VFERASFAVVPGVLAELAAPVPAAAAPVVPEALVAPVPPVELLAPVPPGALVELFVPVLLEFEAAVPEFAPVLEPPVFAERDSAEPVAAVLPLMLEALVPPEVAE